MHSAAPLSAVLVLGLTMRAAPADEPLALRFESLTLSPAQLPSIVVVAANRSDVACQGSLTLDVPADWALAAETQPLSLAPGQTQRLPFLVKRGVNRAENGYALRATAAVAGTRVTCRQSVVVASAPYFKPEIDGQRAEWDDAIPLRWDTAGRQTVVRSYWNRREFCLLVEVEEQRWVPFAEAGPSAPCDAVQLALSPEGSVTPEQAEAGAGRFEFLLVGGPEQTGRCFQLAAPETPLAATQQPRRWAELAHDAARLAVWRDRLTTCYECALPWQAMRGALRPSEGRTFYLSLLVHDADGTGLRDWGSAAGLWPWQRRRLAWSDWPGASWGPTPPFDNKTPWGLCSSKY